MAHGQKEVMLFLSQLYFSMENILDECDAVDFAQNIKTSNC